MDTKSLSEALLTQYPSPESKLKPLSKPEILDRLYTLQAEGAPKTLVSECLESDSIEPFHFAVISFLDAELSTQINAACLTEDVTRQLKGIAAAVMRIGISDGLIGMTKSPIIPILEALLTLSFGWADLKGKALESTAQKLNDALQSLLVATGNLSEAKGMAEARNHLLELLEEDIVRFVSNERDRIAKLEQRLADATAGQLTAERSKVMAARMLNERMTGQRLPQEVVRFLQGPWFDSVQLIATKQGVDSDDWYRAVQLTETLLATIQDDSQNSALEPDGPMAVDKLPEPTLNLEMEISIDDQQDENEADLDQHAATEPVVENIAEKPTSNQRLYRIIENLPGELRSCLFSIEHDEDAVAAALDSIESVHIRVLKGDLLESSEFDLLPTGSDALSNHARISKSLLAPVSKINPGAWFAFHEETGTVRHIKLTLKSDESQYLIFTNRSGGNALQTSFEEFAYLLSSGKISPLPVPGQLLKNVRRSLMSSLKAKAREDEVALLRQHRQEEETRAQIMDNTQFILLAVPKTVLDDDAQTDIVLTASSVLAATKVDEEGNALVFMDQTGHQLERPGTDQIVKLITGQNIEVEDEMPIGMDNFKSAVERMRKHTQLVQVKSDDG